MFKRNKGSGVVLGLLSPELESPGGMVWFNAEQFRIHREKLARCRLKVKTWEASVLLHCHLEASSCSSSILHKSTDCISPTAAVLILPPWHMVLLIILTENV